MELYLARSLVNLARDAAFCIDSKGQFLYVNAAFCRLIGYSSAELQLMSLADLDPDFSALLTWPQWQALKPGDPLTTHALYRTKSGQRVPLHLTLNYQKSAGLEFVSIVAHLYTGADQRPPAPRHQCELSAQALQLNQTEADLEVSLAVLRSTLESTSIGILAINFEGDVLYFNRQFVEMWRLPVAISLSRKCTHARAFFEHQVKDAQQFFRAVWDVPSQAEFESYDLIELRDGRILAHYSQPQWLAEQIVGRVWSVWDVTQSKATEHALRLNETRFRTLAEITQASIFLIKSQRICYANPALAALTGYTQAELTDRDFDLNQLIHHRQCRCQRDGQRSLASEYQEIKIRSKDGTTRWLACAVSRVEGRLDFASEPIELVTATDITDYKNAAAELHQALDQAKQLSQLREHFVRMLCHQLCTPLSVIALSTDLLKRHLKQLSDEHQSHLDHIQGAVKQISQLVDEVLLFDQSESMKLQCEPRSLNLDQFCREVVAQMQIVAGTQKIICFLSQGHGADVALDPKLLQPVLINLLSNAIKYSPPSQPITVTLNCQPEQAIFEVKDAGIGIPAADIPHLFESFYRGSNVSTIPGTGLGLALVQLFVGLHEGEITVNSQVGVGTTFTLRLPLNQTLNKAKAVTRVSPLNLLSRS